MKDLFTKEVIESSPEIQARKAWELPNSYLPKIADHCKELNIDFCVTPCSIEAVET